MLRWTAFLASVLPTVAQGQYAPVQKGKVQLWYRDSGGSGIPVVFLHAATGSGGSWEHQSPVFALVHDLGLTRFHLVGTAAGGGVAF